jgi:hypothetical protein
MAAAFEILTFNGHNQLSVSLFTTVLQSEELVGKPEGRRPLGRLRRGWLDNIRMDPVEVGWGDVGWIGLAQDRDMWRALVNSV